VELSSEILRGLSALPIFDPHSHIVPLQPAARTLTDLLGYHYYTELVHSAGAARSWIEQADITPHERARRIVQHLEPLSNTVQYQWLVEICQRWFGLTEERLHAGNWEEVYQSAERRMAAPGWIDELLNADRIEAILLTNDFDDPLSGWDLQRYVPCLRTDDIVFHFGRPDVRRRWLAATNTESLEPVTIREAIAGLVDRFCERRAAACAISLPPDFCPQRISLGRAATALEAIVRDEGSSQASHHRAAAQFLFWTIAEQCAARQLPFDLMIGVNRRVYPHGVYQGQDLFDSRVSLIQYADLFNSFPELPFPISVLASTTNQELASYAWIFPNVITNGHWWYSNTPSWIARDLAARLEAVPQNKQIGYYSDAYKLEFIAPKFQMYRRVMSRVLAEDFCGGRGWSVERAVALGTEILLHNPRRMFVSRSS
jgi:glucuronate isomerase